MKITYEFVIKYIRIKFDPPPLKTTKLMPKMLFHD